MSELTVGLAIWEPYQVFWWRGGPEPDGSGLRREEGENVEVPNNSNFLRSNSKKWSDSWNRM